MGLGSDNPIVYNFKHIDFSLNIAETNVELGNNIKEKASAYYQFANDLLLNNNIFPVNTDVLTNDNLMEKINEK